jgi:hypothetical protein
LRKLGKVSLAFCAGKTSFLSGLALVTDRRGQRFGPSNRASERLSISVMNGIVLHSCNGFRKIIGLGRHWRWQLSNFLLIEVT